MNRTAYLNDPDVHDFIEWSANLVTGKWGLQHRWASKTLGSHCFTSLFDAFQKYSWRGKGFCETIAWFEKVGTKLRQATAEDKNEFVKAAHEVWTWGGISNKKSLNELSSGGYRQIRRNAALLDPAHADTDNLNGFNFMSSSYSKIYALMIDDFPIYDSRVACTLTSLIWLFCLDTSRPCVPHMLLLGIPRDQRSSVERNPYGFPYIKPHQSKSERTKYANANLKAAWLLGVLADIRGHFDTVPREKRVLALQSALFMLGYQPLNEDSVVKT